MSAVSSNNYAASQIRHSQLGEPPPTFICPITNNIMADPVIDKHGHSFERAAILEWLKRNNTCPMNRQPLTPDDLAPNRALKEMIESYQAQATSRSREEVEIDENVPQPLGRDQNDALAKPLLSGAQDLEKKGQLVDAERLYIMALEFTSKSEDYAHLPRLFEKKGKKERAASAYVILADLQMKEDKQAETIATLKKSLELVAHPNIKEKLGDVLKNNGQKQEAAILFLELAQQALYNKDTLNATHLCHQALETFPGHAETWKTMAALQQNASETLKVLLKGANEPSMPIKERIQLCRMVLIKDPEHLPAKLLSLELNQLKMKDKIKQLKQEISKRPLPPVALRPLPPVALRPLPPAGPKFPTPPSYPVVRPLPPVALDRVEKGGADPASNFWFRSKAGSPAPLSSIGKAEWSAPDLIQNLPPYPPKLREFLEGPCPIWEGKTATETHIVVPLFKNITIVVDGSPVLVPRTLKTIDELDKSSGGVGYGYIWDEILEDNQIRPAEEFHYAVLTRDVFPGSRNKGYAAHKKLVESKGYEMPPILDVVTAILWENRRTGERLLGDNPQTYTRCREKIGGKPNVVGSFAPGGLRVFGDHYDNVYIGVVGFRKF